MRLPRHDPKVLLLRNRRLQLRYLRTRNPSYSSLHLPLETQEIAPTNRRASLELTYWLTEIDPLQRRTEPAQSSQLNEEEPLEDRTPL